MILMRNTNIRRPENILVLIPSRANEGIVAAILDFVEDLNSVTQSACVVRSQQISLDNRD